MSALIQYFRPRTSLRWLAMQSTLAPSAGLPSNFAAVSWASAWGTLTVCRTSHTATARLLLTHKPSSLNCSTRCRNAPVACRPHPPTVIVVVVVVVLVIVFPGRESRAACGLVDVTSSSLAHRPISASTTTALIAAGRRHRAPHVALLICVAVASSPRSQRF